MPAGEQSRSSADRDVLPREESSRKRESVNPVSDPTMARSEQPQSGDGQRAPPARRPRPRRRRPLAGRPAGAGGFARRHRAPVTEPSTEQRTNEQSERQPRQGQHERHGRLGGPGSGRDRSGRDRDRARGPRRDVAAARASTRATRSARTPRAPPAPRPWSTCPKFAELGLTGDLLAGVAAMGYDTPTPIQEQAIPRVLAGHDVVGSAQTGTGKTAAFVLPILQRMTGPTVADGRTAHPSALVVTPTRELCGQIEEVGETLSTYSGRTVVAVFGGVPYDPQAKKIRKGVDLLVATPGRLLDMLRQGHILLDKVDTLVLDEADRMLDMGFWPDVKRIIDAIPAKRQNLFFSATMSKQVLSIIADTLHEPIFIELGGHAQPVDNVEQKVLPVNHDQKVDLVVEYFRHHDPDRTLIFTRTRRRAERLARTLNKAGITCEAIHGDRTQGQRQRRSTASRRARSPCSWPPTSWRAASTWTTSPTSSTSTSRPTPRTTCTASGARPAPAPAASP